MIGYKWQPISPPDANFSYDFAEIDALHRQWLAVKEHQEAAQPEIYAAFMERLTRSWAIETGIIEGLYTLDQGMTETLVSHGISADLIERSSTNKEPQELARILDDHQHTFAGVYAEIRAGRTITRSAIRQIHSALTANQPTYRAVDQFGSRFDKKLNHGAFKTMPNNPTRPDGALHEYCPPEQVDSELDNLLHWYDQCQQDNVRYHPLLTAAWLHHRFTQIHPFEDGNGRVVRALLTWHLIQADYLPVVIKRGDRPDYIAALEYADRGDLTPFVRLLVRLQRQTILASLNEPESAAPSVVSQTLDSIVERFASQDAQLAAQMRSVNEVAETFADGIAAILESQGELICARLNQAGKRIEYYILQGDPFTRGDWYHSHVVQTAQNSGHWANLNEGRYFAGLSLTSFAALPYRRLVFVVSLHHIGRRLTGVMAATAFALLGNYYADAPEPSEQIANCSFVDCTAEPFTFTRESVADALLPNFAEWIERALPPALTQWAEYLS